MPDDQNNPATLKQLKEVIANLKAELKIDIDKSLESFKASQTKEIKKEICKQNADAMKKLNFQEKKKRSKNVILRGIPELSENQTNEVGNLVLITDGFGIKKLNLEESIIFTKRLGKPNGKRPSKIFKNSIYRI